MLAARERGFQLEHQVDELRASAVRDRMARAAEANAMRDTLRGQLDTVAREAAESAAEAIATRDGLRVQLEAASREAAANVSQLSFTSLATCPILSMLRILSMVYT